MKKKKDNWVINDWDDSLDVKDKEKKDPFLSIPVTPDDDDWGMSLDTARPKADTGLSKPGLPKWLIPAVCGICALVLIILGTSMLSEEGKSNTDRPITATEKHETEPNILNQDPVITAPEVSDSETVTLTPYSRSFEEATPTPTPEPPKERMSSPTVTPTTPISILDQNEWYEKDLRYYYQQLTDHEKLVYEDLYDGFIHFQPQVQISPCTEAELDRVSNAIFNDAPELFNTCGGGTYWGTPSHIIRYDPKYRMDQATYQQICSHIHGIIDLLKRKIPAGADDFDKELIIHDYLVDNCEYLIAGDDSTAFSDACLYYGKSQCSGYARAFSLLLRAFGIESLKVLSPTHEWNIVRINGSWYHADSTWDDVEPESVPGGNRYNCWLNIPDRLKNDPDHEITELPDFSIPVCSSLQDNYACREGIFCPKGTSDPAGWIFSNLEAAYRSGKNSVIILIEDSATVAAWNSVHKRFFEVYKGYDWWLKFAPDEHNCQCAFAVRNSK